MDFRQHHKLEAVVGGLVELMEMLHPDTLLPEAHQWVRDRVEDLQLNRRRLLIEVGPDGRPA